MIVILHSAIAADAPLDECETMLQVAMVAKSLQELGYQVASVPFSLDLAHLGQVLQALQPKLIFNLVESVNGRGDLIHLVPVYLEQLRLPYTGGGAQALWATSDKILAKRLLTAANIATPAWLEALSKSFPLDGPYIVKSVSEDGSIGLDQNSLVNDQQTFSRLIEDQRLCYGGQWFGERYIAGREFNVSILASPKGPEVLPLAEIQFIDFAADQFHIVDYAAKWVTTSAEYHNTPRTFDFAPSDQSLLVELQALALHCWQAFQLAGYARVDIRVDSDGKPWVLEVNVNPSLAPDAGFIAAANKAGLDYKNVVAHIISAVVTVDSQISLGACA